MTPPAPAPTVRTAPTAPTAPAARSPAPTAPSPRLRWLLRLLAVLGLVLPWTFNLAYFAGGGSVAPQAFWAAASANALTTAITLDVYLAAIAFACWVLSERRVRRPWLDVLLCFAVGLAVALPVYLLRRSAQRGG